MMTAENTRIIFPGDAGHEESFILEARYPKYLKSDIVQQAHHGHFGTTENFYRLVDASIALFPVTQIKFDEELHNYRANEVSIEIADAYYIASNGTVEIPLPYIKGNVKVYPDETFESFSGVYNLWSYEYSNEYKERLYNEYLELEGVLLTMYDGRLNLTQQVVDEVKNFFPKKVYATVIPRNVRLSEAPSFGEPVLYYDRGSKGAESYNNLAEEFLKMQK
jgi:hypothetical protein